MKTYTTRPLTDRTWLQPKRRLQSRFSAGWSDTLELLYREVEALDGRNLVIEVDLTQSDLRNDGTIRARARAASPAVIVSFDSKHGPLSYRCDKYLSPYTSGQPDWQQNVRAVALTLQALRAVDRYGATETGQQYAGWTAIAAEPATLAVDPLATLRRLAGTEEPMPYERLVSLARRRSHPDTGGSADAWHEFVEATG